MSSKTKCNATEAGNSTAESSHPPMKKAGGIARRHSLIPIALRNDNDDTNYHYQASPSSKSIVGNRVGDGNNKANSRKSMRDTREGGAGTSHMNMKIVRDVDYDTQTGINDDVVEDGGKRQERTEEGDLDALLDEDDEWFEETLDRASLADHTKHSTVGSNNSFHRKK